MEEYKIGENTQCVGRYISMLYRASNCYINKELCKYGIGSGQYIFLLYVFNNNGCNQEEISTVLNIDKGTTARALQKLEKEGYINKEIDKNDRRINHIIITKKGSEIKNIIIKILKFLGKNVVFRFYGKRKKGTFEIIRKSFLEL